MDTELTPELLLNAYANGIFPMADDEGTLHWLMPDPRAIIELDAFRTTRSLRAVVRRGTFEVAINRSFAEVIEACGDRAEGTWISPQIKAAYCRLHEMGFAHSVETWREGTLVGGLYGVALGGAFFGESMFHRERDASKAALVHLVGRMRQRGFTLLDVQFVTEHLRQFGAIEIPRGEYERRLTRAIRLDATFVREAGRVRLLGD
jgi:leucyl/phenylalanyl-tRNA--protein transferase